MSQNATDDTATIDRPAALRMIREAVAERGASFVYSEHFDDAPCQYAIVDNGEIEVACLLGVALNLKGATAEQLTDIGDSMPGLGGWMLDLPEPEVSNVHFEAAFFATAPLLETGESELVPLGFDLTESATRVLWAAQCLQDSEGTWGECEGLASEVAALLSED